MFGIAGGIAQDFYDFLGSLHPDSNPELKYQAHLAHYLYQWLAHGHGAIKCYKDRSIFMMVVVLIASDFANNPDCIRRALSDSRIPSEFGPAPSELVRLNCFGCQSAFDPHLFTQVACDPDYYNRMVDKYRLEVEVVDD